MDMQLLLLKAKRHSLATKHHGGGARLLIHCHPSFSGPFVSREVPRGRFLSLLYGGG
jgi:hypothetical protein